MKVVHKRNNTDGKKKHIDFWLTSLEKNRKPTVKYLSYPQEELKKNRKQTISVVGKSVEHENSHTLMEST